MSLDLAERLRQLAQLGRSRAINVEQLCARLDAEAISAQNLLQNFETTKARLVVEQEKAENFVNSIEATFENLRQLRPRFPRFPRPL